MIKLVLFDLWGTLMEQGTYSPLKQSYSILRPRMPLGQFIHLFEKAFMTKSFDEQTKGFTEACQSFGIPARSIIIEKLIGLWNKNRMFAKPYADTFEVLTELKKKYKLVLVSNTDCFIGPVIERYELNKYFDAMVFSYEVGKLKTDPDFFPEVLTTFKVKNEEALMVGDSIETDIEGAQAAGLPAVLLDRKNNREFTPKIESLKDLSKYIDSLS